MTTKILPFLLILISIAACNFSEKLEEKDEYLKVLESHINAIQKSDIEALKATIPTENPLHWVKIDGQIVSTIKDFVNPHTEWLNNNSVYMDYEIIHSESGPEFGYAIIKMTYYENPDKSGNKDIMHVAYVLKKINENWKVVFDQATKIID